MALGTPLKRASSVPDDIKHSSMNQSNSQSHSDENHQPNNPHQHLYNDDDSSMYNQGYNPSSQPQNNQPNVQPSNQFLNAESENIFLRHYIAQCEAQIQRLVSQPNNQTNNQPLNSDPAPMPEWLQSNQAIHQLPALIVSYEAQLQEIQSELSLKSNRLVECEDELEATLLALKQQVEQSITVPNIQSNNQSISQQELIDQLQAELANQANHFEQQASEYEQSINTLQLELTHLSDRNRHLEQSVNQTTNQLQTIRQHEIRAKQLEQRISQLVGENNMLINQSKTLNHELDLFKRERDEYKTDAEMALQVTVKCDQTIKEQSNKLSTAQQTIQKLTEQSINDQNQLSIANEKLKLSDKALIEWQSRLHQTITQTISQKENGFKQQVQSLQSSNQLIKDEKRSLESQLVDVSARCERLQRELSHLQSINQTIQSTFESEISKIRREAQVDRARCLEMETNQSINHSTLQNDKSDFYRIRDQLVNENETLKAAVKKYRETNQLLDCSLQSTQQTLSTTQSELKTKEAQLANLIKSHELQLASINQSNHQSMRNQQAEISSLNNQIKLVEQERNQFDQKLSETKDACLTMEASINQLNNQLQSINQSHDKLVREKAGLMSELEQIRSINAELQNKQASLTAERTKIRARLNTLEEHTLDSELSINQSIKLLNHAQDERDQWQKRAELERTKVRLARSALDRRTTNIQPSINQLINQSLHPVPILTEPILAPSIVPMIGQNTTLLNNQSINPSSNQTIHLPPQSSPTKLRLDGQRAWLFDNGASNLNVVHLPPK